MSLASSRTTTNHEQESDMETSSEMAALSVMQLSEKERATIDAMREIAALEATLDAKFPARLSEHGFVSRTEAARLLGCTLSRIDRLVRGPRKGEAWYFGDRPLSLVKGKIPLSQLRDVLTREHERELTRKATALERELNLSVSLRRDEDTRPPRLKMDVGMTSKHLGLSKSRVRTLIKKRELHAEPNSRGAMMLTPYEVGAYARKLASGGGTVTPLRRSAAAAA